jgi:hypothetical protein
MGTDTQKRHTEVPGDSAHEHRLQSIEIVPRCVFAHRGNSICFLQVYTSVKRVTQSHYQAHTQCPEKNTASICITFEYGLKMTQSEKKNTQKKKTSNTAPININLGSK